MVCRAKFLPLHTKFLDPPLNPVDYKLCLYSVLCESPLVQLDWRQMPSDHLSHSPRPHPTPPHPSDSVSVCDAGFLKPTVAEGPPFANFALYDQHAALSWLQDNIGRFGGDNTNVTVMGHGTGAVCASLLAISADTDGMPGRILTCSLRRQLPPQSRRIPTQ